MQPIHDILTILETDFKKDIPALLTAAGVDDFDVYTAGQSRNPNEMGLFIYPNESSYDFERNHVSVFIQLQLQKKDVLESVRYSDVVSRYLTSYNPLKIGATMIDSISVDTWPPDNNRTTFIYIDVSFSEPLDSCDYE